ncbi:LytR C-terminal domain-containing protein [Patescibacteria group bacterium]
MGIAKTTMIVIKSPMAKDEEKEESKAKESKKTLKKKGRKLFGFKIPGVVALILIGLVVASVILAIREKPEWLGLTKSPDAAREEAVAIVEEVGKLIDLPEGEDPTIATVSDVDKVRSQPFFTNAQNGDKVIIYPDSRKAILYRPSTGKIIEIGSINIQETGGTEGDQEITNEETQEETPTPTLTPTPTEEELEPLSVVILNGTSEAGLASRVGDSVLLSFPDYEILDLGDSAGDHEETLIVNVGGVDEDRVQEMASRINATISELPEGETEPDTDILIITGADKI